jgi:hypothetical protein
MSGENAPFGFRETPPDQNRGRISIIGVFGTRRLTAALQGAALKHSEVRGAIVVRPPVFPLRDDRPADR